MDEPQETYLGDGLYASWDGYMVTLRAPRLDGSHWVGLEPPVYAALVEFVERVRRSPVADEGSVWLNWS